MPKSVLIVDEMQLGIIPLLEELGFQVDYEPQIRAEEVYDRLPAYSGLVVRSKLVIDEAFLARGTQLEFVARAGAGMDQIDIKAAEKRGVKLLNAPEGNQDALAEHTVGMLLTLFNKLHLADRQVRQRIWDREGNRGVEIKGKTLAVIGYGFMGEAFAKRLLGFGCKVIVYDKYKRGFGSIKAEEVSMEEVFLEADVVSLHVPLTKETRQMVNAEYLGRFKKPVWLINTARGEVVVLQDLLDALKSGKVRGAALDVLENEKLQTLTPAQEAAFSELAQMPNVLFTPHVAGWSYESYERINRVLAEKISRIYGKEKKASSARF